MKGPDIRALRVDELEEASPPRFRDEVRVFLTTDAFDRIVALAADNPNVEVGGVLVGGVFRDQVGAFVLIEDTIDAAHAISVQTGLTFTHATWAHINETLEKEHEGSRIVGWYHTHPGFGVFLSEQDVFIHRSFFDQPFHLAFVYDPSTREHGCFAWRDGEVVRLRKYWIGDKPCFWAASPEAGKLRQRESVAPRSDPAGRDIEGHPAAGSSTTAPARGNEPEPRSVLWSYVTAILVAALLGGAGGFFLGSRKIDDMHGEYEKAVMKVRLEATNETLRAVRTDLVTVVRRAADDEVRGSTTRIAEHVDRAGKGLGPVAPAASSGAKELPSDPPDARAVEAARVELAKARALLAELQKQQRSSANMLRALDEQAAQGPVDPRHLAKDLAATKSRLGQVYAEMAELSLRVGDRDRSRRLLEAAALTDPHNAARYHKALEALDPKAQRPGAPAASGLAKP